MYRTTVISLTLTAMLLVVGCAKPDHAAIAAVAEESGSAPTATSGEKRAKKDGGGTVAPSEGKTSAAPGGTKGGATGKKGGARGGGGQVQPVEVTTVVRRDLIESLKVVGSLAANETASIRPEMAGIIRTIHFEEGLPVKKGELLLKIDDQELVAQMDQSKARFELVKQNLARAESLQSTQSNTQADVDRARSEFAAAQADLRLLEVRIRRTEIRAPFDGVVGSRTLSPGDYVNTQSIVTTLNDLSRLKAEFQIPERFSAKVRPGTTFTVRGSSAASAANAADVAQGEVYFVNSVIDRNTRSSDIKGYMINPPAALKAGMFAVIEIVLEVRKNTMTVPEGAIFVDQRGPQLIGVREQEGQFTAMYIPVKLGLRSMGLVEIVSAEGKLDEGQKIVGAGVGSLALFPGARLDPRPLREDFRIPN